MTDNREMAHRDGRHFPATAGPQKEVEVEPRDVEAWASRGLRGEGPEEDGDGWGQESGPRLDNASADLQELGEFTKLSEAGSPHGRVGTVVLPSGFL